MMSWTRATEDYAEGHIPGGVNLPKDQWQTSKGLRKDKTNVLYCYSQVCHLAAAAAVELVGQGFSVIVDADVAISDEELAAVYGGHDDMRDQARSFAFDLLW